MRAGEAYSHLKSTIELKDEGNAEFRAGRLAQAVEKYRAALRKAKREPESEAIRGTLLSNQAVCLVKLSRWEEAIEAATAAIATYSMSQTEHAKTIAKALVYRARAYRSSEHRNKEEASRLAMKDLRQAHALDPKDRVIVSELRDVLKATGAAGPRAIDASQVEMKLKQQQQRQQQQEQLLPGEVAPEAALGGALRKQLGDGRLYDERELERQREAEAVARKKAEEKQHDGPPREWVLERMQEALDRQRALREDRDDEVVKPGYARTSTGAKTPAWSSRTAPDPIVSDSLAAAAAPVRVSGGDVAAPTSTFNRGYKEVDVSTWCRRRLLARLRPLQVRFVDGTVHEGAAGVVRCSPMSATGEALLVRVGDRWDRAYDLAARFSFEAKLGAPRTKNVKMKDKSHRMFMGVPTVRGAVVVRELTHVEGPKEAVVELEWGYGGAEMHFEKDEVGMTKAHAAALRALLGPPSAHQGTIQSAIIEMLERFVEDFETEIPGQPRPHLGDIPLHVHNDCVAADEAYRAAALGVEMVFPSADALEPWKWEKPVAPKTTFDVAPGSKLAEIQALTTNKAPDEAAEPSSDAANADEDESDDQPMIGHQGDARGGFSHKMMEQFEALHKQGYTVLLGEQTPEPEEAPAPEVSSSATTDNKASTRLRPGTVDYSKFDDLDVSDDDDEEADYEEETVSDPDAKTRRARKIKELGGETSRLWDIILKIAKGDVAKAQDLMKDPDSLQRHPEIRALYAEDTAPP